MLHRVGVARLHLRGSEIDEQPDTLLAGHRFPERAS
jgi:hypothetical protein